MSYKRASASIAAGREDAPRRIVIFHGYTGSPDEFETLADILARHLDAYVEVPLLPGHGTREEDLLAVSFDDFLNAARDTVRKIAQTGKPFGVLGHSFGGYLALLTAEEFSAAAVALTVVPYKLRFPFWVPGIRWLARLKNFWDKKMSAKEEKERQDMFFYPDMPGRALDLVDTGNARIDTVLEKITCPILTIHNVDDPLSHAEGGPALLARTQGNLLSEHLVFDSSTHGLFYGPGASNVVLKITQFFERAMLPHKTR